MAPNSVKTIVNKAVGRLFSSPGHRSIFATWKKCQPIVNHPTLGYTKYFALHGNTRVMRTDSQGRLRSLN